VAATISACQRMGAHQDCAAAYNSAEVLQDRYGDMMDAVGTWGFYHRLKTVSGKRVGA